jgi:hypothetical protein
MISVLLPEIMQSFEDLSHDTHQAELASGLKQV